VTGFFEYFDKSDNCASDEYSKGDVNHRNKNKIIYRLHGVLLKRFLDDLGARMRALNLACSKSQGISVDVAEVQRERSDSMNVYQDFD
jgi:hypothetical protein